MLFLVGYGIDGIKGISLEGLDVIRRACKVYIEDYTSPVKINLDEAERVLGRKLIKVSRRELEEEDFILRESGKMDVALLTPGDPLIATTHVNLLIEAFKLNVKVKVIHASSIYTAAMGESGLQAYKFGKMVTLTFPEETYPLSVYEVIKENKSRGLHTLILLQYDAETNRLMSVKEAFRILLDMEDVRKENVLSKDQIAIILSGLGFKGEFKAAGKINDLIRLAKKIPKQPSVIIIPGRLHSVEKEALKAIWMSS